ncbi:MAG: endonuclease/exonuclease/phosphatase family protein [Alistipes sp.]|nr:endonuclease/exonuclease/phosphatase family protein [Alistipes sp.]
MAEYYTQGIRRTKRRRNTKRRTPKEVVFLLLDAVVVVTMAVLLFATVATIVAQYISPEKTGVLSVLALVAPVVYLLDVATLLYWVARWKWRFVLVALVPVVLGLFYLPRHYRVDIMRNHNTKYIERHFTKVLSYNILEGKQEGLVDTLFAINPDILCLQEVATSGKNWERLAERYRSTYTPSENSTNQILTRYRILRSGTIDTLSRNRAVWADLMIEKDTVRVVNVHLKSTSIRKEDTQFLENHEYILDAERNTKLRSIVGRLVENNRIRALQAQTVAKFVASSPYRVIVCGDFNDVPLSYTYYIIGRGLKDTFSEEADGYAYTYDTTYGLLRIDNILVSPSIEVISYEVDNNIKFSDHFPVVARLKIQDKK